MPKYLLDTNIFIQSHKQFYNMDFCPGFWNWLNLSQESNITGSIIYVIDELCKGNDILATWASDNKKSNWAMNIDDEQTQTMFSKIVNYVEVTYDDTATKQKFYGCADPWIIAKAAVTGATVVTQEKLVVTNSSKIKIPNICQHFNINYINIFDLLKVNHVKFILEV